MKKLLLLMLISLQGYAQLKTIHVKKTEIGYVDLEYLYRINTETGDSSYYVWFHFKDMTYEVLTQYSSVWLENEEEFTKLVSNLKLALAELENRDSEVFWKEKKYGLIKWSKKKHIYLYDDRSGYTVLSKSNIEKMIAWLSPIGFGSPTPKSE